MTLSGPISPILSSGKLELGLYAVKTVGLLDYSDGEVGAEAATGGGRALLIAGHAEVEGGMGEGSTQMQ